MKEKLEAIEYNSEKDYVGQTDIFGPLSNPVQEHCRIPENVKVVVVDNEDDVDQMDVLFKEKFIGLDSEWRTRLHKFHDTSPSVL